MLYIKKEDCPEKAARQIAEIIASEQWDALPDPADPTLSEPQRKAAVDNLRELFDTLDKDAIRMSLLKEQHGLCAYCMRKIENNGLHTTIEHWKPLSKGKSNALSYQNFLGTCKGGSDEHGLTPSQRMICCEAQKGNDNDIYIDPQNAEMMRGITYTRDGIIEYQQIGSFDTEAAQHDIDVTLRLNGKLDKYHNCVRDTTTQLVKHRRDAYTNTEKRCTDKLRNDSLTVEWLRSQIEKSLAHEAREEFVGVSIYVYSVYLEKLLKKAER